MSIASEITRITSLRDRIRDKLIALGLLPSTPVQQGGNDLFDCTEAIEDIGGTKYMTDTGTVDVAPYQYARVNDANLTPKNIVEGVTILGVTGTASVTPSPSNLQQGHLYYGGTAAPSSLYPSSGYDGFSQVVVEMTDANPTLLPQNVRRGTTIMGVTGTLHHLQNKSVTLGASMPSTQTPTSPYDGLSQVSFSLDSNVVKAENIKQGVSILGVAGTHSGSTPTQTKSMALGAAAPSTVTPDSGYALSSVSPSIDTSVVKSRNIRQGVSILGVNGLCGSTVMVVGNPTISNNGKTISFTLSGYYDENLDFLSLSVYNDGDVNVVDAVIGMVIISNFEIFKVSNGYYSVWSGLSKTSSGTFVESGFSNNAQTSVSYSNQILSITINNNVTVFKSNLNYKIAIRL